MKKITLFFSFMLVLAFQSLSGQNEDCFDCHSDDEMTLERKGKEILLYVDEEKYGASVHADLECVECHMDFDAEEEPHKAGSDIYKVDCYECHEVEDIPSGIHAEKNVQCFDCHSKHEIQEAATLTTRGNEFCMQCHKSRSVRSYALSTHNYQKRNGKKKAGCNGCHGADTHAIIGTDYSESQLEDLCAQCHKTKVKEFRISLHGRALANGKFLAPNCITCHDSHAVIPSSNKKSKTYKMNIPGLCGECHKEGTKISDLESISQHNILEDYQQSIHGDGLFRRGLIVSAVCTDCHFTHNILPHENRKSSINRNNIVATCTQCHVEIERVHKKVIRGELWEKQAHLIPACIDCHQPHKVRRVYYEQQYADQMCMKCHADPDISVEVNGKKRSLYVDPREVASSAHNQHSCIKCHTQVNVMNDPVCLSSGPVDCSVCHAENVNNYYLSIHGQLNVQNDPDAPYCTDCHGKHLMKRKVNLTSRTFAQNIPSLCADCHQKGKKAAERMVKEHNVNTNVINNYTMSIHGKGLLQSGLMVTATCVDCHTAHLELPAADTLSSVNLKNIAATCGNCHLGIFEKFKGSIHSPEVSETDKDLPGCADCHHSHTIKRVDVSDFRQEILDQCGRCHLDVTETYFETFHGKVSKLGSTGSARCYDCHGSHDILPSYMPESKLSRVNVVETCKSCHPGSNRKFVGYLTHATHHDRDKYPWLYYTFWSMTILLISTFSFFGLHTLLWLPRAYAERKKLKKSKK